MARSVKLEVITPSKLFYDGEAELVTVTTVTGSEGFMAGHSWATKLLAVGELAIQEKGRPMGDVRIAAIAGGFIDVKDTIIIYTDAAEWAEDIDMERALSTKATLEDWIKTRTEYDDPRELARVRIELAKNINRMKIAGGRNRR